MISDERASGKKLFQKLCGPRPCGHYFHGGLFEEKESLVRWDNISDIQSFERRGIERVQKVVATLSDSAVNNVSALALFAKEQVKYTNREGYYDHKYLEAWVASPKVRIETINNTFVRLANSFKTLDEALPAFYIYDMFLEQSISANNPWTIERSKKPGYQVIPYFAAAGLLNDIVPTRTKDQYAYLEIVRKIKTKGIDIASFYAHPSHNMSNFIKALAHFCPPDRVRN